MSEQLSGEEQRRVLYEMMEAFEKRPDQGTPAVFAPQCFRCGGSTRQRAERHRCLQCGRSWPSRSEASDE